MPEAWTGRIIGKMHNNSVTSSDVAKQLGVTKAYVSMILNGRRAPKNGRERIEAAVNAIVASRAAQNKAEN